jgi:ankyrin repeat protein
LNNRDATSIDFYGDEDWQSQQAKRLGLLHTLRVEGRPKAIEPKNKLCPAPPLRHPPFRHPQHDSMMVRSPVDIFCSRLVAGDRSAVRDLLASGIDLNIVGSAGRTPLMLAASEGLCGIIAELTENGALVSARGENGMTALHEAASNGHSDAVRLLIGSGANVDAETIDGVTPLMCAAAWGHVDAATILIKHGADCDRGDRTGATAYDIAREKGENKTAEFLRGQKRGHP